LCERLQQQKPISQKLALIEAKSSTADL